MSALISVDSNVYDVMNVIFVKFFLLPNFQLHLHLQGHSQVKISLSIPKFKFQNKLPYDMIHFH